MHFCRSDREHREGYARKEKLKMNRIVMASFISVAVMLPAVGVAAPRIRKTDPTGLVVAGATSQIPLGWLEDCFKKGLFQERTVEVD
jgi:hypothetical protein